MSSVAALFKHCAPRSTSCGLSKCLLGELWMRSSASKLPAHRPLSWCRSLSRSSSVVTIVLMRSSEAVIAVLHTGLWNSSAPVLCADRVDVRAWYRPPYSPPSLSLELLDSPSLLLLLLSLLLLLLLLLSRGGGAATATLLECTQRQPVAVAATGAHLLDPTAVAAATLCTGTSPRDVKWRTERHKVHGTAAMIVRRSGAVEATTK